MRRCALIIAALATVVAAAAPVLAQGAARRFTIEELLKLRRLSDPRLAPNGTKVAFVMTEVSLEKNSRANHIWIVPVGGGEPVRLLSVDGSEDTPRWSPDGKRIAFISAREGGSQVWLVDAVPGAMPRKLTAIATEAAGVKWSPDGKWLLFVSDVYPECDSLACNERMLREYESRPSRAHLADRLLFRHWNAWKEGRFSHLFLVPADGSAAPLDLTPGRADVPPFSLGGPDDYAFAPDSKEVAYAKKTDPVEAISTNSELFVIDLARPASPARKITTNAGADGGPLYSPDGRYLAYRMQARAGFESDRWQLMLLDRKTSEHRSITASFDRPADSYTWLPDSKGLLVVVEDQGALPVYRLDVAGGAPVPVLSGGSYSDVQVTPDGRSLLFSRSTAREPADIFRSAADGTAAAPVTRLNEAFLHGFGLRAAESVSFEGAGGAKVQAWMVKPPSFKEGQKYPLLYLVHGGPQSAWNDSWGYRWNPQVFASAGYVVMMPNPRGSTGFGQRFTDQISGDWGGKVFDDLMAGADFAAALPYVDATRTGAAGASYGGYMMNWFLGHTLRFKAIVSHAGVFNLESMWGATEELWFPEWDLRGTPWTNPDQYARFSPHKYAKNFMTPTLVTHGELDFRVPVGEGLQLFTTLQRLGVPSKLVVFPDEGHWINRPANSALWYRSFIEWMDRYVKGEAAR